MLAMRHSCKRGDIYVQLHRPECWDVLVARALLYPSTAEPLYWSNEPNHVERLHQSTDGLYGALILHSPDEIARRIVHYDQDVIVMVGDYYST